MRGVVAPATVRRWLWPVVAVAALAVLAVLATTGHRPEPGLARFEAAGIMVTISVEDVTAVDVRANDLRWRFERFGAGGQVGAGSAAAGVDFGRHVELGLRFLHVSAPQGHVKSDELQATSRAEFGLDPPHYVVSVEASGGRVMAVAFGTANFQGHAQYAQIGVGPDVVLLPRYVGEAWETATGMR
jgi:hypothetical protein